MSLEGWVAVIALAVSVATFVDLGYILWVIGVSRFGLLERSDWIVYFNASRFGRLSS